MRMKHADLVGTSIVTKNGTKLDIVAHNGKAGYQSRHLFYCAVCANDAEVFGGGIFQGSIYTITKRNTTPCGCSNSPRLSEYQYYVKCRRVSISLGLRFYGFIGKFDGVKTKVNCYCEKHGALPSKSIRNLMDGSTCRKCFDDNTHGRAESGEKIEEYLVKNKIYPEGVKVTRLSKKCHRDGSMPFLRLFCPICARDEYSQAGLCRGVFETIHSRLKSGSIPCRCRETGKKHPWSIREMQISSVLESSGFYFVGLESEYVNASSSIICYCNLHGRWETTINSVLKGSGCPKCSATGYNVNKVGFLYLLVDSYYDKMKIGITNNPKSRFENLRRKTPFAFDVKFCIKMQGAAAPVLERKLLQKYERLGLKGFDGATEWCRYEKNVLEDFS